MKKQTKLAVGITAISAITIAGSAFAFFNSSDEQEKKATAGTVGVEFSELQFENSKNINPGDNDPNLPADPDRAEGTSHKLTFNVTNTGTKSIRTKHEITITMKDNNLDPSVFAIYDLEQNEIVKKYYQVNGEFITQEDYDNLSNPKCTMIKYIVASDIFDGIGLAKEQEDVSTVKENNNKVSKDYTYQLAMSQYAKDEYQGQGVDINVSIYAIQYRNMDASDWYLISSQDVNGSLS